MKEIRKQIPQFPGYEVSNLGQVRNTGKKVKSTRGAEWVTKKRIMKTSTSSTVKYKRFYVDKDGKRYGLLVHRLVYCTFHDEELFSGNDKSKVVNHIDHNKLNNKLDNLEMISQKRNMYEYIKFTKGINRFIKWLKEEEPGVLDRYKATQCAK